MRTFLTKLVIVYIFLVVNSFTCTSGEDNWTHFRGSNLSAIANVEHAPLTWDEETNIKWKTAVHGRGWSSPVVFENQVWVTTANTDGSDLYAVCLDFDTGDIIHDIKVFSLASTIRKHDINSFASPTPAIEDGFVYVHYGSMGTACINSSDGSIVWTREDLRCDHVQGPGSSAFLYDDLLILHYEGVDERFIVALDKHNGENVWKTYRQEEPYKELPRIGRKAYVTPLLVNVNGRDLIISNGSAIINAYDPRTGEEVWSVVRGAESTVAMPFAENGIVYFETGFMRDEANSRYSEMMAVNPDGKGDITETNVLWTERIVPFPLITPVIRDGLIYTVDRNRKMKCYDAADGQEVWSHNVRGEFNSSPIYVNGKVYFNSTRGETLVIDAGRELNILAENKLDGEIWSTPAILRNSILMRTDGHIYRIGTDIQ